MKKRKNERNGFFFCLIVGNDENWESEYYIHISYKGEKKTMNVAAHGNVDEYCESHGMTVVERYSGDVAEYRGSCSILVTDNCEDLNDYYYLKYLLRKRKIELLSTHWHSEDVSAFVRYMSLREEKRRKGSYPGRMPFGFKRVGGVTVEIPEEIAVARRVIALRDAGAKYREIVADPAVAYSDGRRMSVSTIQVILRNRGKYDVEN